MPPITHGMQHYVAQPLQQPLHLRLNAQSLSSSAAGFEQPGAYDVFRGKRAAGGGGDLFDPRSQTPRTAAAKQRTHLAGVLHIRNTWNNTHVAISTMDYKTKATVTAGKCGFKKSKRSSFFATEKVIQEAFAKARAIGIRKVMINMSGPAISLRKPLFRTIREQSNLRIMKLRYSDNVPHGGCRPRKSRRRRFKTKSRKRN